jgi:GWxTD domain-containing protein
MRSKFAPVAGALLLAGVLNACASTHEPGVTSGARIWFEGPVRWLMQPEEMRRFRSLRTNRQALEFIETFWQRRDPTPGDPENPFRDTFLERASAADRLYSEEDRRGSLTDRGRTLILLGSPAVLRYQQRAVPTLETRRAGARPVASRRWLTVEVWSYPVDELPPNLAALLPDELQGGGSLNFSFVAEERRTYLLEGNRWLELAARAALQDGS